MDILKITLKYFPKALLGWLVSFVGFFVVPFALIGLSKDDEHLPAWAWPWDEPFWGINGDPYWRGPEHADGKESTWWWRLQWLYRNMAIGYSTKKLGFVISDSSYTLVAEGDPDTSDQPNPHEGKIIINVTVNNGTEQIVGDSFYMIKKIPYVSLCFRVYIGYKFMGIMHGHHVTNYPESVPFVYHISIRKFHEVVS